MDLVNVVKVVAEENSVFFEISCSQVQKLLTSAPEIRHLLEGLVVVNEGNQRNISGNFLNGKFIVSVKRQIAHVIRGWLFSKESAH